MGRKSKWKWLKEFKTVQDWLKKVRVEKTGSKATESIYLKRFGPFINWIGKTPDELTTEAEKQERAGNKKWAEEQAIDFFDWLTNAEDGPKAARTTAQTTYGVIRSFFRHHDILFYGKTPRATSRSRIKLPSREELSKVWKAADLNEKLALSILRSGFRSEDAVALTYGDVKEDYEKGADRLYVEKVSEKEDLWFGVYLTKEATEMLRLRFEQRKREGEVFTDKTPLICRERELGEKIGTDMLWRIVKGAGERVGVKLMPKMFRKYFRTNASPVIGRDATMKMGAWKIPGVGGRYFLPPKEQCLRDFLRIEPLLTFEEAVTPVKEPTDEEILEALKNASPEQREAMWATMRTFLSIKRSRKLDPEVAKLLEELREKKTATNGGQADCQRIVTEQELPALLAEGWHVAAVLPSGKVVVSNGK